jgi:hypothetical protein
MPMTTAGGGNRIRLHYLAGPQFLDEELEERPDARHRLPAGDAERVYWRTLGRVVREHLDEPPVPHALVRQEDP